MNKLEKIQRLQKISKAVELAAQANLSNEMRREQDLRTALDRLSESRTARTHFLEQCTDTALVAGADGPWRTWIEQRRALINSELARCLARQAVLREKASLAFGRCQSVQEVTKVILEEQKKTEARRNLYVLSDDIDN